MSETPIDRVDRAIIRATQAGLPLVPFPYHQVAAEVGTSPDDVMRRMRRMLEAGMIRRIGAVPNHYALGLVANAMTVWDVDDEAIGEYGPRVGALEFVSHCYHRPRRLPEWPYNLFVMVHGRHRAEIDDKVQCIAAMLGKACRRSDILLSKRILKKSGLRLSA
ncbi:MAG: Lrp/AsnC family transcriptional regulator [Hyphomicrobiaceae bacterium]|nr:MAG: Lrp/AsnC family transcriptional regulator [Hyphomicrobiaceae bacterium]